MEKRAETGLMAYFLHRDLRCMRPKWNHRWESHA